MKTGMTRVTRLDPIALATNVPLVTGYALYGIFCRRLGAERLGAQLPNLEEGRHDLISGARRGKTVTCYCTSMLSTLMVSSSLVPVTLADTVAVAGVAGSVDRSARLFRASAALEFPALSNL
jgi:hypothetical protein